MEGEVGDNVFQGADAEDAYDAAGCECIFGERFGVECGGECGHAVQFGCSVFNELVARAWIG